MTEQSAYTIVPVGKEHLPALFALERDLFGAHGYPLFVLRQLFDASGDTMLAVVDGDSAVAGYTFAMLPSGETKAWLMTLAVDSGHRRRGIGRQLIGRITDMMRARGANELLLTVDPNNDGAITLYRRCGFEDAGFEQDYFGSGEDRNVMQKKLT